MEKAYPDHKKYMGFKYMYSFKTFNKQPSLKFFHSFFPMLMFYSVQALLLVTFISPLSNLAIYILFWL